jgi:septation ring formation regulator EzrA
MADYDYDQNVEEQLLEQINTANALRFTLTTEGWDIIDKSFQSIEEDALTQLGEQQPGNDKAILAAFSVWYSVRNAYNNVKEAVSSAIQAGEMAKITLGEIRNIPNDNDDWA